MAFLLCEYMKGKMKYFLYLLYNLSQISLCSLSFAIRFQMFAWNKDQFINENFKGRIADGHTNGQTDSTMTMAFLKVELYEK